MASDRARARRGLLPAVVILLAALALPSPARAQEPSAADKETARTLMDRGDERMDAKDYPGAVKAYVAADALMHLPMTGFAVARAQAAAGLLLEARDLALQVKQIPPRPRETPAYARARADAAALADALAERIPSIQVVIDHPPAGVVVAVDGAALPAAAAGEPRKVNPGAHVITVSASGFLPARTSVTVREGAALVVPLVLTAAPATPVPAPPATPAEAPPRSPAGPPLLVAGFSVGGAGVVVGAIAGGLSLSKTATLKNECAPSGNCMGAHGGELSAANALANVSNAAFAVAAAGVALGVAGLVLSRPRAPTPVARVEPLIGPGTLGLRLTF